jgi:phage protein D
MANLRFVPEFRVFINGKPIPAVLRASIASVSYTSGLEGADRVELSIVNENLRWLDDPLLAQDNSLTLEIGYAPDPLEQVFVGEIVGQSATFPASGAPMLTIAAHDYRQRLQLGTKVRWFAIPASCFGMLPIPDPGVASLVSFEHLLIPIFDPISAALSVLFSAAEVAVFRNNPDSMQKIIRKQVGETDYDFLRRLAHENGWEMLIDHSGPLGGRKLHFLSPAEHRIPDLTLKYGESLIDFTPRISKVGQVAGISARIWQPDIKTDFTVTASWDWDRNSLDISISAGVGQPAGAKETDRSIMLVEEPLTQNSAPRVILSKLLSRLNQRLTGSGSTIGDPRIQAGKVLLLEGLGKQFSGLYRITSATHSIDGSSGYRTHFEVRKEIWFGSIPMLEQGAVGPRLQGERVRA